MLELDPTPKKRTKTKGLLNVKLKVQKIDVLYIMSISRVAILQ